jgi:hypothetical protein
MPTHLRLHSLIGAALLLAASGLVSPSPATAAETLRVGKAVPEAFSFCAARCRHAQRVVRETGP